MDDDLWLAAPCAAVRLWNDESGLHWQANAAALEWARRAGVRDSDWLAIAQRLHAQQQPGRAARGELDTPALRWNAVPLGAGWLAWLQPGLAPGLVPGAAHDAGDPPATAADDVWRSTADKLDLAQQFGRLGIWERDLRTGELRWDDAMYRLFAYAEGDSPAFELAVQRTHPDDRERVRSEYRRYLERPGRYESRFRLSLPDGSLRHVHALFEVRGDAEGRPCSVLGVMIDDTEGTARTLKFQKALDLAKVSVWHIDAALQRIHFNEIGYRLAGLGAPADGLTLDAVRATLHPDDLDAVTRAADQAMREPGAVDVEARYRNPDGSYRHLLTRRAAERDAQGRPIGLMGISLDQTEQIAQRERARALAQRIELVTEAARVGLWSVDAEGVEWNAEMRRIYGLAPGAAAPTLQRWLGELIHADDRRALMARRRRSIDAGELDFEAEFRIVRPDGEVRWVACRSRRELRGDTETVGGIHLDVTEQTLQRQQAEQAQRDRIAAERASFEKSEFLARISHELRTPLNAVLGFAQLLERDAQHPLAPGQLERVGHIRSAGEHLLALIGDVLDLSSIEAGNLPVAREPVSIDAVLADVASWIEPLAERAHVDVRVEPGHGWVLADAQRLRQILVNLASDAVKYGSAGGSVWLRSRPDDSPAAPGWHICVCDDGRGLTATEREHLAASAERIDRARAPGEPASVGLTIVRRLVEFMGGRLDVDSGAGPGSEFRVWLPRAAPPAVVADDAPAAASAPRLTIHYIEDNPVNVILVKELVGMRPEVALECSVDGTSGVARAVDEPPDVVLIDMQLPDIDGYEVLARLRAEPRLAGCAMIALSANGMSDDIARAKAAGFDDYWTKPIDFRRFLAALDALAAAKLPAQAAS